MEQKKSYVGIRNSADSSTLELYFTDFIFNEMDWDTWEVSNMVQEMIDKVNAANPSNIKVTINSLGGDVMIGLAIYNFLKNHKANVEVEIIGFAASIASIIAMSASKGKLKMAKNAFMIIHAASSGAWGNAKEMREQAEVLDTISNQLADIYALRSGKTAKHFTDMWADGGDVWLTGAEAKDLGLVDSLMNAVAATAHVRLEDYGFKNIPAKVTSTITQNLTQNMAFTKTIATAKAQSLAVVEGGFLLEEEHLNNIEAALSAAETAEANLTTANQELATARQDLAALQASSKAQIDGLTAAAATDKETITARDARIKELEAEVAALGKQPSGKGTPVNTTEDPNPDPEPLPAYLDPNSPENKWFDKQAAYIS